MLTVEEIIQLGPYRLIRELGSGGMGIVFEAEDMMLNRRVALKILRPGLTGIEDARGRFLREARAMAQLIHDNVVTIFQVHEDRGYAFMAMQLLAGETLESRCAREQLKVADIVRIGKEIAEGLSVAHDKGIIHRDIKPANIWLEKGRDRVKLLDFGLARRTQGDPNLTLSGVILGTPGYMSPEQARGEQLDPRSDLFSLGCVLYELLTGERPFDGSSVVAMLREVEFRHPPRVTAKRPEVSTLLSNLVMELLSKNRKDRPASALLVMDRLMRVISPPVHHLPPAIISPALLAPLSPEPAGAAGPNSSPVQDAARPSGSFRPGSGASGTHQALSSNIPKQAAPSAATPASPSGSTRLPPSSASPSGSMPVVVAPGSGSVRINGGNPGSGAFSVTTMSPSSSSGSYRAAPGSGMTKLPSVKGDPQNASHQGIGGFLQFGILFMVLSGLVWGYYHLTNKGTLGIDCDDAQVEIEVKQNGEPVQRLQRGKLVQLQAGDYEIAIVSPAAPTKGVPEWRMRPESGIIKIRRKETEIVTVYPDSQIRDSHKIDPLPKKP